MVTDCKLMGAIIEMLVQGLSHTTISDSAMEAQSVYIQLKNLLNGNN
jgi:hypothetical protein